MHGRDLFRRHQPGWQPGIGGLPRRESTALERRRRQAYCGVLSGPASCQGMSTASRRLLTCRKAMNRTVTVALLLSLSGNADPAIAQALPRLAALYPPGARTGSTLDVAIRGGGLEGARQDRKSTRLNS